MDETQGESPARHLDEYLSEAGPRPVITAVLIAINAVVFVAMVAAGVSFVDPAVIDIVTWGGNAPPLTRGGEWWRLGSSMFVHVGIFHIVMNMVVLADGGRIVERLVGHAGFLAMYVVSGLVGSLASLMWNQHVVSAGASGAVFGVFGCLLGLLVRGERSLPAPVRGRIGKLALLFIGYNVLFGSTQSGIDMAAHLGGLAGGFLCGLILAIPRPQVTAALRRKRAGVVAGAGVAAIGIAIAALSGGAAGEMPLLLDQEAKVRFGDSEVYYTDGATREQATALRSFLVEAGYFSKQRPATVVLSQPGGHATVGLVTRDDLEIDSQMADRMRFLGAAMSLEVFDGNPVVIDLLDSRLRSRRKLAPADASLLEQQGTPPILFGIELEVLRSSALYRRHEGAVRALVDDFFADGPASCGWPLVGGLRSVLVRVYASEPQGVLIVVRGISRSALDTCVRDAGEEGLSLTHAGDASSLELDGLPVALHWLSDDSFMFEIETGGVGPVPAANPARLATRVTDRVGYDGPPTLAVAADRVNRSALWFALADPSVTGQVTVGDGVTMSASAFVANERALAFALDLVRSYGQELFELPSMQALGTRFSVTRGEGRVEATAELTEQELFELWRTVAADEALLRLLDE